MERIKEARATKISRQIKSLGLIIEPINDNRDSGIIYYPGHPSFSYRMNLNTGDYQLRHIGQVVATYPSYLSMLEGLIEAIKEADASN